MRTTAKRLLAALLALLCCGPAFGIPAASAAPPSPANILTLEEALVLTNADQAAQCSFTPALGGFYTFHFQNNAAAQASNLSIEDAEGTLVYSGSYNKANNDYGSEHIFTAWLAGGKTYTYTHAFGLNGFNYALSVMREAVEPLGPGVLAEAAVPGNRFGSQSFAYFEFTAPAAGWYAFGSPTNPNLDGRLYTADGGYLGSEYGGKLHAQLTAGQTVIYAAGSLSAYSPLTVFVQVNAITPYTVTYDYNNGSGVKQTMNTPGKLGPYTPAKAGYEFAGWALTAGAAAA
ncbi:MAG: InlB B-repeat-containing protein, partial [Firmicutes bacterium]|nr:InlB B-repeat-containing protein [Bacillota bacterium]